MWRWEIFIGAGDVFLGLRDCLPVEDFFCGVGIYFIGLKLNFLVHWNVYWGWDGFAGLRICLPEVSFFRG